MARKTVIKTCVLYADLRILARKIARLSSAAKFYSGIIIAKTEILTLPPRAAYSSLPPKKIKCLYPLYIIYKTDYAYYE